MIINGSSNRCVWWWTQHLESEDNDKVRIADSYGLRSENIHDMLREMEAMATGTRCANFFYQMNMNPGPGEVLTEKEWDQARQIAEKKHGLEGQPYFMVMHVKYGREHPHFIYSRIDRENMRAISDSNDARTNHAIAREIEREFGLQKVIGPYDREPGTPRPPRAPKKYEMYRDKQHGLDTRDIQAEVTELFQQSQNGPEFKAALEQHGYDLVTGRRGLLILDTAGNEHSLARRCGITMKEMDAFMRDVDRQALPTVEQGKVQRQERKIAALEADRETVKHEIEWEEKLARAAVEKEKIEGRFIAPEDREKETRAGRQQADNGSQEKQWPIMPPQPERKSPALFQMAATEAIRDERTENLQGAAAEVWTAYRQSGKEKVFTAGLDEKELRSVKIGDRMAFAAALDNRGIAFAVAQKEEADRSHREAEFARAAGNYAPRYKEGEIVLVTKPRPEYRRDGELTEPRRVHKLDQSLAEKFVKTLDNRGQLKGIEATKQALDERAEKRGADREAARLDYATNIKSRTAIAAADLKQGIHKSAMVAGNVLGRLGKGFHALSNAFDSLISPKLSPEQIYEGEKAKITREAEAEYSIDFSRYTADRAHERQNHQEQQAARDRQREIERDR